MGSTLIQTSSRSIKADKIGDKRKSPRPPFLPPSCSSPPPLLSYVEQLIFQHNDGVVVPNGGFHQALGVLRGPGGEHLEEDGKEGGKEGGGGREGGENSV